VLGPIITAAEMDLVNDWAGLPSGFPWNLCYKGTRDDSGGFYNNGGAVLFHQRCDNRGPSFFVAKTQNGNLFGGYTSRAWESGSIVRDSGNGSCSYHYDPDAFLFSLTNNFKHTQTGDYASAQSYSVYDCYSYGPVFGGGSDFFTNLKTESYTNLGHEYACRVGSYGSRECREDFAGNYNPLIIELEVYTEF
jgi:TLD protein